MFKAENKLEELLIKASSKLSARPLFYAELLSSDIFIIQDKDKSSFSGNVTVEKDTTLSIQNIEYDNKLFVPFFSSLKRLTETITEEVGYIAINGKSFFELTGGADLLLNPGADYGKEFLKEEIQNLLDGKFNDEVESISFQEDTQVFIGQPADYPKELVNGLKKIFRNNPSVQTAFLAHYHNPSEDKVPHTLIGVDNVGDWNIMIDEVGVVLSHFGTKEKPIDVFKIDKDEKGGISEYFLLEIKPFYKKKIFGIF